MPSIRDVARAAGVSPATVSRTFATPSLINVQTQKRVLDVATSLNYRPPHLRTPRVAAPSTRAQRPADAMNAVGFQFFSATTAPNDILAYNEFYSAVQAGAQAEAASLGLHLLIHTTDRRGLSREMPRMILEKAVGGLLLVGTAEPRILSAFAQHVPNIVLVDNHDETETHESVVSDGFAGGLAATKYLLDLGHRRIGFFLDQNGVMSFQDRLRGCRCALFEAGVAPEPGLTFGMGATTDESARAAMGDFLRSSQRPTAVFCCNDDSALFLMRLCREIGLVVPNDLSVVGFDDMRFAQTAEPPLTTVRVEKEFLGRLAVRRLFDRFKDTSDSAREHFPVRHVVPVSLIVRDSCQRFYRNEP